MHLHSATTTPSLPDVQIDPAFLCVSDNFVETGSQFLQAVLDRFHHPMGKLCGSQITLDLLGFLVGFLTDSGDQSGEIVATRLDGPKPKCHLRNETDRCRLRSAFNQGDCGKCLVIAIDFGTSLFVFIFVPIIVAVQHVGKFKRREIQQCDGCGLHTADFETCILEETDKIVDVRLLGGGDK